VEFTFNFQRRISWDRYSIDIEPGTFGTAPNTKCITKLCTRHLKSKHNYIIQQTMVTVNNYMFRPLTGHHQVVHTMKSVGAAQYTM